MSDVIDLQDDEDSELQLYKKLVVQVLAQAQRPFLRGNPGNVRGERYREGPFPEREDARWYAWQDAWTRGVRKKPGP